MFCGITNKKNIWVVIVGQLLLSSLIITCSCARVGEHTRLLGVVWQSSRSVVVCSKIPSRLVCVCVCVCVWSCSMVHLFSLSLDRVSVLFWGRLLIAKDWRPHFRMSRINYDCQFPSVVALALFCCFQLVLVRLVFARSFQNGVFAPNFSFLLASFSVSRTSERLTNK